MARRGKGKRIDMNNELTCEYLKETTTKELTCEYLKLYYYNCFDYSWSSLY